MTETFYLQFSSAEQVGQALLTEAQVLTDTLQQLRQSKGVLFSSGLQGAFLDDLERRCAALERSLGYVCAESDEAGRDLLTVAVRARQTDAEAARLLGDLDGGLWLNALAGLGLAAAALPWELLRPLYFAAQLPGVPASVLRNMGSQYVLHSFMKQLGQMNTSDGNSASLLRQVEIPIAKLLMKRGGRALTEEVITLLAQNKKIAERFNISVHSESFKDFRTGAGKWGGAVVGGVADWAFGDDHSVRELGVQVTSGLAKHGISLLPMGGALVIADAGIQIAGTFGSNLIENNALWIANGDPALAEQIKGTADRYQEALDAASLDKRLDSAVDAAFRGDVWGVIEQGGVAIGGVTSMGIESIRMAGETLHGLEQRFGFDTPIDDLAMGAADLADDVRQGIADVASDVGQGIADVAEEAYNSVLNIFGW